MGLKMFNASLIILAGGRGSRLGGVNKGLMLFNNQCMIDRILSRVQSEFDDIIVVTNTHLDEYRLRKNIRVISDEYSDYRGPLAGIHAGLLDARHQCAFILPCDAPGPIQEIFPELKKQMNLSLDLIIPHDGERLQPLFSLVHKNLLPGLQIALADEQYKVSQFFLEQRHKVVSVPQLKPVFQNVNTPSDLDALSSVTF
ncbi:molybdenum cofactor guanylyltransferase [Thiomicrorhabdus sp. Milos-T2]|uniref:molybdenum cofactor guanylyltransferase n=1 Tax=Thiomicrorhabdus sp. Milos-T2 TaxID=90814 RepID=UPI000494A7AB|nr:molybdenum cofactor guanylyltransferase [Thiomicrorhabdus sp. Milos-T2]